MFRRILIANRGEIALRILKTVQKMGIEGVVAYSEADRNASYLKQADDSICIGEGPASRSYLQIESILQAAHQKECQAIHPGYGFLSENPHFSYLVKSQNIAFIGPPPDAIHKMGDKVEAKKIMAQEGVPVLPGELRKLQKLEEALEVAKRLGYPVLLKASAGGGGRGMRIVKTPEEMERLFPLASQEAFQAFGDGSLYLEKYIEKAKHIEFQILVDRFGQAIHLGERECSIQRRHQKLIEESPSPSLTPLEREEIGVKTAKALAHAGYENAGTVEFLRDEKGHLYFMEVNARLQVEHPVTEMITRLDLVREQIRIAAGHPLSLCQKDVVFEGHAIECRINAEDPEEDFRPTPGTIRLFSPPRGEHIRLDTHVVEGYTIPSYYDSMIAKLIVWGQDRKEAIARMQEALSDFQIEGVPTTIPFLLKILELPEFQDGTYHIHTVEKVLGK